jgi:hypothetical protein
MEKIVSAMKDKRQRCQELQQELDQLENALTKQVLADTLAALKREVPLLESIVGVTLLFGYDSFTATFTNGVTMYNSGSGFKVYASIPSESLSFTMDEFALSKPGFVFKHKIKATRIAVNDAIAAWKKLLPLMDQVLPSNIKRRCLDLNTF